MKLFERIEDALQKRDRYNWAKKLQHFEAHFVSSKRNQAQIKWTNKQYKEYRNRTTLLQREIYLQEELSALTKLQSFTEDEKESVKRWQEELETFDERFWLNQRAFYKNLADKPKGPWTRWWDMGHKDFFLYSEKSTFHRAMSLPPTPCGFQWPSTTSTIVLTAPTLALHASLDAVFDVVGFTNPRLLTRQG
jgi:hypothetical protein